MPGGPAAGSEQPIASLDDIAFGLLHHDFADAQRFAQDKLHQQLEVAELGKSADRPSEAVCKPLGLQVRFGGPPLDWRAFEVIFGQVDGQSDWRSEHGWRANSLRTAKGIGWGATPAQVTAQYGESHWTISPKEKLSFTLSLASPSGESVPGVSRRTVTFTFYGKPTVGAITFAYISDVTAKLAIRPIERTAEEVESANLVAEYAPRYIAAVRRMWEAKSAPDRDAARVALKQLFGQMQRAGVGSSVVQSAHDPSHPDGQIFVMFMKKVAATEGVARGFTLPAAIYFPDLVYIFRDTP